LLDREYFSRLRKLISLAPSRIVALRRLDVVLTFTFVY